jgi:hypothetical protein
MFDPFNIHFVAFFFLIFGRSWVDEGMKEMAKLLAFSVYGATRALWCLRKGEKGGFT